MGFDLIAAIDWTSLAGTALTILKVAAGLGFVIFVHELGHFLVAKSCGVKCEKFYIGFDIPLPFGLPSSFWRRQWGETEYGIGVLPLGGYVKMLGQDDNPLNAEEEAQRTRLAATGAPVSAAAGTAAPASLPTPPHLAAPFASGVPAGATAQRNSPAPRSCAAGELDPRSYTAKAVWQRMLIISAGVVMNLIFAVIFAAFAYRAGVPYTPCEIGQVIPGGPAWKAGFEPHTRIVQIGEDGKKRETLRFDFDLRQSVGTHGDGGNLALLIRDSAGHENWKQVRPFTLREGWESSSTIGISPAATLKLLREPAAEGSSASTARPALQGGDTVVAVDGQSLQSAADLQSYLARYPDRTIKLRLQRPAPTKAPNPSPAPEFVDVEVAPQRLKDLGLVMQSSPITAVRPGSSGAKAGLQVGDVIEAVEGKPVVNGMMLPEMLRPYFGQAVTLQVKRAGTSTTLDIRVELGAPNSFDWMSMFGCSMASDALGVAYDVSRQVKHVVPDSPAAKVGFQVGDVITALEFAWKSQQPGRAKRRSHGSELKLDDRQYNWPACFDGLQQMIKDEVVKLTYDRGGQSATVVLAPVEIDAFNPDRGLQFEGTSEIHRVASWGDAVRLGARQTWEEAFRVVGILKKLVTGRVSVANLGGIGSIAYVAGSEASRGTSRLLIFLTMLSANLAVLNFMPIPALDGGHMMFLLYEGIFRRPVNERLQYVLTLAGVACLLGLMIFVNAMDIQRFFFR